MIGQMLVSITEKNKAGKRDRKCWQWWEGLQFSTGWSGKPHELMWRGKGEGGLAEPGTLL